MVLQQSDYNASYYGDLVESGGILDKRGYGRYQERNQKNRFDIGNENNPYNPELKALADQFNNFGQLNNKKVLDLGGGSGYLAEYVKVKGNNITWDVLDWSEWCSRHVETAVDTFINENAHTYLPTLSNNAYDFVFSMQFLDCIDELLLPALITQINRICKNVQVHVITTEIDPLYSSHYTIHDIAWWAQQGFKSGTRLVDYATKQITVV